MVSLNRVILAGNLTRDPEVRYTPSGNAVADLNLAVNRVYTVSGERKEEVCYVGVVVWGRQAETSGEYLSKGSPVLIEGILQYDQWENDKGEKRSRLRVRADRVQFLSSGGKGEYRDAPKQKSGGSSAPPQEDVPPAPSAQDEGDDDDLPF